MTKIKIMSGLKSGAAPFALGLALVSTPVYAQSTEPTNTQGTATTPDAGPLSGVQNPANATGEPSTPAAAAAGDIIVTGSRIPQPNLTAVSPITVVNQADFKLQGTTRAEDLLNSLPQVFADQGSSISNGSTGTATINLRNLGANRTLVLVNGRRLVPGDPTDSSADVNFIPSVLVKRVDVLTGGASSTYGADAVGGVVNFIMDTDFTGFKLEGQYSFYNHKNNASDAIRGALNARGFGYPDGVSTDGGTIDATAVIGAGFDDNRGHVTAYVGYRKINAVTQGRRDYSACAISASKAGALSCGGSATSANGTLFSYTGGTQGNTIIGPNGQLVAAPYADSGSSTFQIGSNQTLTPGFTPFNYAPTNYYQRPDERYTAGFFANYDVDDAFKPYLEGMFMDDRTVAQIAPSGDFGNTFTINSDNPLLSPQQRGILFNRQNLVVASRDPVTGAFLPPPVNGGPATVASDASAGFYNSAPYTFIDPTTGVTYQRGAAQILKRNVEGAPRQDDLQHTSYRIVVGSRGDLTKGFSYDAYYQYGRTNYQETYLNDFSISRLRNALDVVNTNGQGAVVPIGTPNSVPACRVTVSGADPNCVPYNLFTLGGVTPEAVNYVATPGFQRGQTSEQIASINFTGLLGEYGIKSPYANDGVGINVGFEYRKESLNLNTDIAFQTGDLAGQGAATLPIRGSFQVYEGFGEVRVPIIQQGVIYDLSLEGGYRYSNYDLGVRSFSTNTYKGGFEVAPIRAVRFRGAYNRAVRAPNIQELFAPQRVVLSGTQDNCAGFTITAADAGCIAQGLTVGQLVTPNPAGQYNGLIGGNPNISPEKADTYTVGVVVQPGFLPILRGLAVTVDYFNIKVNNLVSAIGSNTIVSQCTNDPNSPFCGLINRDSTGSLWRSPNGFVTNLSQNIGSLKTTGIDVGGSYAHEIGGLGSLSANFNGTFLNKLIVNNGVAAAYDCAGLYGFQCGTPSPEWRHKARATITLPDGIGLSGQWRYFGSVHIDRSTGYTTLNPGFANNFTAFNSKIKAQNYFDLALTATVGDHLNFRIGAQNILDRDPPTVPSAGAYGQGGFQNGNTYPVVYDALGRYIYAGATINF